MTAEKDTVKGIHAHVELHPIDIHVSFREQYFGMRKVSLTCIYNIHIPLPPPSSLHPVRDGDVLVLRRRDQDPVLLPASNPSGRRKNRKDKKRSTPGSSKVQERELCQ